MNRRKFLTRSFGLLAAGGLRLPFAHGADYSGRLCVFIQADGGWDPTSFCDPKVNTPGEPIINHWAERDEVRQAGNIRYAPFADNLAFFEKYYGDMLVINGVDAQTNSHSVGVVHNWSGRNSEGFPTTTALVASDSQDLPMSYISFGGYAETGGLTRYTRLENPELLRTVAYPRGVGEWRKYGAEDEESAFVTREDWEAIRKHREAMVSHFASADNLLPSELLRLAHYSGAFASGEALTAFADAIPFEEELEQPVAASIQTDSFWSNLRRQVQLTVLAFKTGVSVSADLWLGGFDTHARHDIGQGWLLTNLTDGVDFLWEYAEMHGIADRLFVVIGSDFGRTNYYNADDGKDHWPIGSFVIMEKNQSWTNRSIGMTDDLHFAQKINAQTLERDDDDGTIIYPKHVHKAIRTYLGFGESIGAQRFPFNNTEDFAFFG